MTSATDQILSFVLLLMIPDGLRGAPPALLRAAR